MTHTPVFNPSQGMNLGGKPNSYGDTFSVLNLFHGADAWLFTGADGKEVRGGVKLDQYGWPVEFPKVNGEDVTMWANIFYTRIMPAGTYIVEWKGSGKILPYQDYEGLGPNKYRIKYEANYSKGDDGITLRIDAGDSVNTGNNVRDVKIYNEKYADLVAMGELFDPEWFQAIDDFRVLRTHDWQGTNFSKVRDWTINDVTTNQAFWGAGPDERAGVPFEGLVKIANDTRSDLWINIPHMATDDYMRKAAAYVKKHLDKDLRVYVEYSNEYWTTIFDQHQYLKDKGQDLFGNAPFANAQAYGARASEMTQVFKQVFGTESARLFPTITVDSFNTKEAITVLTTPAYVAKGGISPLQAGIKHLATDGYFHWYNTDPEIDKMVDGWIAKGPAGFADARDFLINEIKTRLAPDWALGRELADKYNLSFGIYEGGALLINGNDNVNANPKYTNFNEAVQLSPEMKQVYEVAAAEWQKIGGGPFAWYSDVGRWGPWGDYGLWNAPDFKPEKRTEAIIAANKKLEAWMKDDPRPASTFANGLYDAGTIASETITGTHLADRLYGLAGNDTLSGLDDNDILVGGFGKDTLRGGTGSDTLLGGASADTHYGDAGFDFVSYQTSTTAIYASLTPVAKMTGEAAGDRFFSIEGLIGGSAADVLTGDSGNNTLFGGTGNDALRGRANSDRLYGGAGEDRLSGGTGDDVLYGGSGKDYFYMGPGKDIVMDWLEGDFIAINIAGTAKADAKFIKIGKSGTDTLVTYATGTETWSMTLKNIDYRSITLADDFILS